MRGFWAPLHPSDTIVKRNGPPTPKRVRLFGRHNSSRGATFVAMMQTSDLREGNDLARGWWVYWARLGAILVQRQMRARLIVIGKIRSQDLTQMPLAENENVIQTVAPKRSNEPFSVWILPRRSR
jgi:hypothetical protein